MGPVIYVGKRPNVMMEVLSYTSNENFAKELEDALMKFTTTYDDSKEDAHSVEQTKEGVNSVELTMEATNLVDLTWEATDLVDLTKQGLHLVDLTKECNGNADGEIDIMDCKILGGNELVEGQRHETTESSSSFGNSGSDDDTLGDEASSDFHGDMFRQRRKKLTPHWKSFIQPLVWRCKWAELQIKNLESQAKKYDRKLAEYSQQNHIQSSAMEGIGVKSLPFSKKKFANKVLKRKRRKRTESTTDLAAHMSNHNLFSYYENRKSITEAALMDKVKNPAKTGQNVKDDENLWAADEFLWAQPGDGDDSMEHLLHKIMSLESQVGKIRSRVNKVITENAGKFSDLEIENLSSLPIISISSTSSSQNTAPCNGGKTTVGTDVSSQFMMKQCVGDAPMPETAATSHANVTGSENLAHFADALKNGKDDVIVYKKKVKKQEKNDFEGLKSQPIQMPLTLKDGSGGSSSAPLAEIPDMPVESQPSPKVRSIANLTTTPAKSSMGKRERRKCSGRGNPRFSS